jgi:hypothetical protein
MGTNYYKKANHDISILDPSTGDTLGFLLARDDLATKFWREVDGKSLVDLFDSSTPTQFSTDPEKELLLGQSDWRSGFGLEYQDSSDPRRYFNSIGCDLRFKGMAMAGWGSTACTTPDGITPAATLANKDMEANTSWTGGAQSATDPRTGTYEWTVTSGNTAYQAAATFVSGTWIGQVFTFSCWARTNTGGTPRIGVTDDSGTTWSANGTTGGTTYEYLTASRVISAGATYVRCTLSQQTAGAGYFDDCAINSPTTGIIPTMCHVTFNSLEYIAKGNMLCKLNAGGTEFTGVAALPATISSLCPFQVSGTDYLMIGQGLSANYYYMTTGEILTESNATDNNYQYFTWVNTTVDVLYGNDAVNKVRSTVNPLNGGTAWSTQTVIGAASEAITHLQEKDGALLIDKTDMPYYLSSAGAVQKDLAPECVTGKSSHSGKNSILWQGEYFRPTGDQALLRSGTYNSWIQPGKFATNNSDYSGEVSALAGNEEWLYAFMDTGSSIGIVAGREETIDGDTRWIWHPIYNHNVSGASTEILRPTSAGDETNITNSTAVGHYTEVDEVVADETTTMVYENSSGTYTYHRDLYNLNNTAISGNITNVRVYARGRYSSLIGKMKICIKTNSAVYESNEISLANSWENYYQDWSVNPYTGTSWTAAELNSLQIGVSLAYGSAGDFPHTGQCTQVYLETSYVPTFNCETAWISTVYQKRLWFSGQSATDSLYYLPMPTKFGNICFDSNRAFLTGTSFETSWLHGDFPLDQKALISLTCTMGHTYDADVYWNVQYKKLGDSAWSTNTLKFDGSATSMTETHFFEAAGTDRTSSMIKLKFTAVTDSTSLTPILLSYKIKTVMLSAPKRIYWAKIRVGEGVVDKQGMTNTKYALQKTCLENARANVAGLTTIINPDGETKYVRFLPVQSTDNPRRTIVQNSDKEVIEFEYNLLMMEVPLS